MNRTILLTGLICMGIMLAGVPAHAQDSTTDNSTEAMESTDTRRFRDLTSEERAERREQFRNLTPEERAERREQFRNLTPEERAERSERFRNMSPEERREHGSRIDRDNNPPGRRGGPGTNWENPPGRREVPERAPTARVVVAVGVKPQSEGNEERPGPPACRRGLLSGTGKGHVTATLGETTNQMSSHTCNASENVTGRW